MKPFAWILFAFACAAMAQTTVSPLAGGVPDATAGIMGTAADSGPRWGKCVVVTRCFDSTCAKSMSSSPSQPGADPGGMVLQVLDTRYCADRQPSAQDTLYGWVLADACAGKWDSLFGWMGDHSYSDSGYFVSILNGLTEADKKLFAERKPLQGRLASPIKFEAARCESCAQ